MDWLMLWYVVARLICEFCKWQISQIYSILIEMHWHYLVSWQLYSSALVVLIVPVHFNENRVDLWRNPKMEDFSKHLLHSY